MNCWGYDTRRDFTGVMINDLGIEIDAMSRELFVVITAYGVENERGDTTMI